jgi:hypothetical protein
MRRREGGRRRMSVSEEDEKEGKERKDGPFYCPSLLLIRRDHATQQQTSTPYLVGTIN